jgi:hypothetical protein
MNLESESQHLARDFWLRWEVGNIVGLVGFNSVANGLAHAMSRGWATGWGPESSGGSATVAWVLNAVLVLVWRMRLSDHALGRSRPAS